QTTAGQNPGKYDPDSHALQDAQQKVGAGGGVDVNGCECGCGCLPTEGREAWAGGEGHLKPRLTGLHLKPRLTVNRAPEFSCARADLKISDSKVYLPTEGREAWDACGEGHLKPRFLPAHRSLLSFSLCLSGRAPNPYGCGFGCLFGFG